MTKAELYVWAVEQGASLYILTPNYKNTVIDCGASDVFSPIQYLYNCHINQIDYLIISHPHEDHINDIMNIEQFYWKTNKLVTLALNKQITEDLMMKSNSDLRDSKYINKYFEIGSKFTGSPSAEQTNWGCSIKHFWNTYVFGDNVDNKTINNLSLVTFIKVGEDVVLYGGDMEKEGWEQIMKNPEFIEWLKQTTIYIVSHHGNKSGYYSEMFRFFRPKIMVVPAGKKHDYDAVGEYCDKTDGMNVYKNGSWKKRKVLTTRNDGHVHITLYSDGAEPKIELE